MNSTPINLSTGSVTWGAGSYRFELRSTSIEVLEEAARVLEPWLIRSPEQAESGIVWSVEPRKGGWEMVSPADVVPLEEIENFGRVVFEDLESAILTVEFQAVVALLSAPDAPLSLHGALLARRGGGVAVVGTKNAGKSTLSVSLWTRGWELLSDDGFFRCGDGVRGVPRRIRLRASALDYLRTASGWTIEKAQLSGRTTQSNGSELFHPLSQGKVSLRVLVLLDQEEGPLSPLETSEAMLSLVAYTNTYRLRGVNASLAELSSLLDGVRCYRLGRASLDCQYARLSELL